MIRMQDIKNIIFNLSDPWTDILCKSAWTICTTVHMILNTSLAQIVFG